MLGTPAAITASSDQPSPISDRSSSEQRDALELQGGERAQPDDVFHNQGSSFAFKGKRTFMRTALLSAHEVRKVRSTIGIKMPIFESGPMNTLKSCFFAGL
jgi:hypothetical protein